MLATAEFLIRDDGFVITGGDPGTVTVRHADYPEEDVYGTGESEHEARRNLVHAIELHEARRIVTARHGWRMMELRGGD